MSNESLTADVGRVVPIYKGAYDAGTAYELADLVAYNGSIYWHWSHEITTGIAPTDQNTWGLVVDATATEPFVERAENAAQAAENAKDAANNKAAAAESSALIANNKAAAAATSAENAAASESNATQKEALAAAAALAAGGSASGAASSAADALTHRNAAAQSAQDAAASQQAAKASEDAAAESAAAAEAAAEVPVYFENFDTGTHFDYALGVKDGFPAIRIRERSNV